MAVIIGKNPVLNECQVSTADYFLWRIAVLFQYVAKVICHEMGHALKLAHPNQSDTSASIHSFANEHGSYPNQISVYAIMNQGLFNCTSRVLTAAIPQDHDYINLISKWEYHLDCDH